MKRTKYFNHTKPGQGQLNYTETCRINSLLERSRKYFQFGIASGFRISVNSGDTTKIDISSGEGYTGGFYSASNLRGTNSGERIYTETVAATGQALADYTNGVKNYVSLIYQEVESVALPERFYPFTSHNTIVSEWFSVSVLTETSWNLLTAEQKQNRVLVGIVTAKGAGVALTSTDIDQLTQPKTHPIASQPSNITGVTVIGVAGTTQQGTATLTFSAPNTIRYTAPNDTIGTATTLTSSGEYTVYSATSEYTITIDVIYANLPAVDATDSITISSLYGRTIPIASAADIAHRDMVGTGTVTTGNPHGVGLADIAGGLSTHADYFHVNAINRSAASGQLLGAIAPSDIVQVANLGGGANTFLIDGVEYQLIAGKNAGEEGEVAFLGTDTSGDYLVYLDSAARPQKVLAASFTPVLGNITIPVLWTNNIAIYDMRNTTVGTAVVTWDATAKTLQYTAPGDSIGTGVYVNTLTVGGTNYYGYYIVYSNNGTDWIIVFVNGDLGGSNASTFTTNKSETTASDESILKISVVTWDATNSNLRNIRDIRTFASADNYQEVVKEHDASGFHTKELRNTLRVGVDSYGIHAVAEDDSAIVGVARSGSAGIYGSAPSYAVYGIATSIGVYGTATGVGVYGRANNVGVSAVGSSNAAGGTITALVAMAENPGAATQAVAIVAIASGTGINAQAATAIYGMGAHGAYIVPDFNVSATVYGVYVNDADLSDDRAEYYGVYHAATGVAGKSVGKGYCYKNSYYVGTADTAIGFYNIMTARVADMFFGDKQQLDINAAGSVRELYIYSGAATAASVETAKINYCILSASSVANLAGFQNSVLYKTCAAQGIAGLVYASGDTVSQGIGWWVRNTVAKSAVGMQGIINEISYAGDVIPDYAYGIYNVATVKNGLDVLNNLNYVVVSSGSLARGIYNSIYATQAQKLYGYWQQVSNGDVATCAEMIGMYNKVHGGNASQATCVGNWLDVTGNVAGNVCGEFISVINEGAAQTAYGVYAYASAAVAYGVRAEAPTIGVYGIATNAAGIGGVFAATAANGVGVSAVGKSVGAWARATTGPATAGYFDATVAGGTAIVGLGLAKGAYVAAGDAAHATAITAVHAVATADEALTTVIGVYGYATNVNVLGNQYGVCGTVSHAMGCGVVGLAAKGIGVYASGSDVDLWCAHGDATAALRFDQYKGVGDFGGAFATQGAIKISIGGVGIYWMIIGNGI